MVMVSDQDPSITLVIPVYNESASIEQFFGALTEFARNASQVIFVDGNSNDGTYEKLEHLTNQSQLGDRCALYRVQPGRARQMNYGMCKNTSEVVIFVHCDTILPENGLELVGERIRKGGLWGRFDVELNDRHFMYRIIEKLMNIRSSITDIATGDQAIFVRTDFFRLSGGFPEINLMEDIALSENLKQLYPAERIRTPVKTSARRWQSGGIFRTIVLMWIIRLAYWLGVDPARLERWYVQSGNP